MTHDIVATPITELSTLLDAERVALLGGDLDQVTKLLETKEILFDTIDVESPQDTAALRALDDKVKRNQLLLDGALQGIRAVADRMAALRKVQTSLETYGADGRRKQIALKPQSTVERRA
jgi:flagellar biosynthesis/type III secretory pathway chaperone